MFTSDPQKHILCDASFLHAYFNEKDLHHIEVKNKVEELLLQGKRFALSANTVFELMAAQAKRKREGTHSGVPYLTIDHDTIPLDFQSIQMCFEENVFEEFPLLRGMDLINASLAKIFKIPLATCDKDFKPYEDKIELIFIK